MDHLRRGGCGNVRGSVAEDGDDERPEIQTRTVSTLWRVGDGPEGLADLRRDDATLPMQRVRKQVPDRRGHRMWTVDGTNRDSCR